MITHQSMSEIPEFMFEKFRNFGVHKRPEIPEFPKSGIPELQSLTVTAESVARCENSIVVAENTIGLSGTVEGMLTLIERQCSLVTEIDYLCVVIFSFFYCTI